MNYIHKMMRSGTRFTEVIFTKKKHSPVEFFCECLSEKYLEQIRNIVNTLKRYVDYGCEIHR